MSEARWVLLSSRGWEELGLLGDKADVPLNTLLTADFRRFFISGLLLPSW
jgi:hypothetical protein